MRKLKVNLNHVKTGAIRPLMDRVVREGDRIHIYQAGVCVGAIVSVQDLESLESLEDEEDERAADEAAARSRDENDESIPLEQALQELGA